ncbi:MAG: HEAT repeat domain-containing protein [Candidatus Omnitrophota bacterium]
MKLNKQCRISQWNSMVKKKIVFLILGLLLITNFAWANDNIFGHLFSIEHSNLSPEVTLNANAFQDSFFSIKRHTILKKLKSSNWVQARDAAEEVMRENIIEAEEILIELLESDKARLLSAVIKALEGIKSKKSVGRFIKLYNENKDEMRFRDVCFAVIEALGTSESEEAMLFLIQIIRDENSDVIIKKRASRSLGFYEDRRAVEALMEFSACEQNMAAQEAIVSLGYIAGVGDIKRIQDVTNKIKIIKRTKSDEMQEREGFGDNAEYFHWLFLSSAAEKIRNRSAGRTFVLGDVRVSINEDVYLKQYKRIRGAYKAWNKREGVSYWKNPDIAVRYLGAKESEELLEKSGRILGDNEEHPDVRKILNVLAENNINFYRSKNGLMMVNRKDNKLALWSKDGSVLIPMHKGYIPYAFAEESFPVRGETVIFPGKNPLLVLSESLSTVVVPLSKKFPDIDITLLPIGFVTYKLKNGEDVLIGTSHIDCVIERIPPEITYHGKPILIIDPRYYAELQMREDSRTFLDKLKREYNVRIVVVEKEEEYLNPANFIQLPDGRIIINKAPKTIAKLIDNGLMPDKLIVLKEPVSSMAALKGLIGCLGGIYTNDRIPSNIGRYDVPLQCGRLDDTEIIYQGI